MLLVVFKSSLVSIDLGWPSPVLERRLPSIYRFQLRLSFLKFSKLICSKSRYSMQNTWRSISPRDTRHLTTGVESSHSARRVSSQLLQEHNLTLSRSHYIYPMLVPALAPDFPVNISQWAHSLPLKHLLIVWEIIMLEGWCIMNNALWLVVIISSFLQLPVAFVMTHCELTRVSRINAPAHPNCVIDHAVVLGLFLFV